MPDFYTLFRDFLDLSFINFLGINLNFSLSFINARYILGIPRVGDFIQKIPVDTTFKLCKSTYTYFINLLKINPKATTMGKCCALRPPASRNLSTSGCVQSGSGSGRPLN